MAATKSYSTRPHPDEVPGYARAVELGLTPRVPGTPPELVCPPAHRGVLSAACLGLLSIVVTVISGSVWCLVLVFAAFAWIIRVVRRMQVRERLEVAAGYRLAKWRAGTWGGDPERRYPAGKGMAAAPWDLRGLWFLDERGGVVAEPDRSVLPPGMYPSPNRPGELEMWTGRGWMYNYRTPAQPFLDVPLEQG